MSATISILSKPKKTEDMRWRVDGEDDQIIIVHRDNFALPRILNPVAAKIFLLSDGNKTIEEIISMIRDKFEPAGADKVSSEVTECVSLFVEKGILTLD